MFSATSEGPRLLTAVLSITVIWTAARLAGIGGQTVRARAVEGAVAAA